MNENINLTKILKNCPEGTELWSDNYGTVKFVNIDTEWDTPIKVELSDRQIIRYTEEGWCNKRFLKVGDKVVINVGDTKLCIVERVTKMYITAGGIRFNRRYGWATGANDGSIRPATEEDMQKYGNSAE